MPLTDPEAFSVVDRMMKAVPPANGQDPKVLIEEVQKLLIYTEHDHAARAYEHFVRTERFFTIAGVRDAISKAAPRTPSVEERASEGARIAIADVGEGARQGEITPAFAERMKRAIKADPRGPFAFEANLYETLDQCVAKYNERRGFSDDAI